MYLKGKNAGDALTQQGETDRLKRDPQLRNILNEKNIDDQQKIDQGLDYIKQKQFAEKRHKMQ
jgi:hypothetical protein